MCKSHQQVFPWLKLVSENYTTDHFLRQKNTTYKAPLRYKCLSRRSQNDIIETEAQPILLLHHSKTSYEGIYTSKALCMRRLTVLWNGPLCSVSLTNQRQTKNKLIFLYLKTRCCKCYTLNIMYIKLNKLSCIRN